MPAHKKTSEDREREAFAKLLAHGKAETGLTDAQVAEVIGMSESTLWRKKQNPDSFSFREMKLMKIMFSWEMDDIEKLMTL